MKTDIKKKEIIWEDEEQIYLLYFNVGALGNIKNISFAKGNKGDSLLLEQKIDIIYSSKDIIKNIYIVAKLNITHIARCLYRLMKHNTKQ